MNTLCECPYSGLCARHGVNKTLREHDLCRGANCTAAQSERYWTAWEEGRLSGQSAPVAVPKEFVKFREPRRDAGFGDWMSRQITRFTGVTPCGGCKGRAAWLNHWFPADLPAVEPVDLDDAVRHVAFHLWPVAGYGAWQWNCDRLLAHANLFNGRRIVSIAIDSSTDDAETVKHYMRDFTDEFLVVGNHARLREVVTFVPMLEKLEAYQSPQDVTLYCHGKCVRHRLAADATGTTIFKWAEAMWETVPQWERVRPLLENHATVGSFRRQGTPQPNGWGPWHYSGTFYWFRNRDAFRRNWRYVPQQFYGVEAWPGLMFRPEEAACVFADNVQDLYQWDYWNTQIQPQLEAWRQQT